ncbi:hypothetical protein FQN54_006464 [Arachnomyces sp. PD_36]|nr:hypothetical protein FQN54_006464 [Arachnomyces sp. PD_36]
MRLLKASTIELEEFPQNRIPPYAILSHTWGTEEVTYDDFQRGTANTKASWTKVQSTCQRAVQDGQQYVWIDSCCIDKSSSAELSEAINSMYSWYGKADICYAYLVDVPTGTDPNEPVSAFVRSRWFTRGFTLQELIAPSEVVFLSKDWVEFGTKTTLCDSLAQITLIDEDILLHRKPLNWASVARRMSWAAHRQTTRIEDIAYCLMGIFSVNMPMLYGEGEKAFLRLQEEIMKESDDQSIFAWVDHEAAPTSLGGLLAASPSQFAGSCDIFSYQAWKPRPPYAMTNRGLQISVPLSRCKEDNETYIAVLDCPSPPEYKSSVAIFLKRLSRVDEQFARVKMATLIKAAKMVNQHDLTRIYVRQSSPVAETEGVFPVHMLQLRMIPTVLCHGTMGVMFPESGKVYHNMKPPTLALEGENIGKFTPCPHSTLFSLERTKDDLSAFVTFVRSDGSALLLLFGTHGRFEVGFDAFSQQGPEKYSKGSFDKMRQRYQPKRSGVWITLEYERVRAIAEPQVQNNLTKCYMIDIEIEPLDNSNDEAPGIKGKSPLVYSTPCSSEHFLEGRQNELANGDKGKANKRKDDRSKLGWRQKMKSDFRLLASSSRDDL